MLRERELGGAVSPRRSGPPAGKASDSDASIFLRGLGQEPHLRSAVAARRRLAQALAGEPKGDADRVTRAPGEGNDLPQAMAPAWIGRASADGSGAPIFPDALPAESTGTIRTIVWVGVVVLTIVAVLVAAWLSLSWILASLGSLDAALLHSALYLAAFALVATVFVLIASRVYSRRYRALRLPPSEAEKLDKLFVEMEEFFAQSGRHLRVIFWVQLSMIVLVFAALGACFVIAAVNAATTHYRQTALFGGSGSVGTFLSAKIWGPFEKLRTLRKESMGANFLALSIQRQRRAIEQITDPAQRLQAERELVELFESKLALAG